MSQGQFDCTMDLVRRLEEKWRDFGHGGPRPDWRELLPAGAAVTPGLLIALCMTDVGHRLERHEQPPLVLEYAAGEGRVGLEDDKLLALIQFEYQWCWQRRLGAPANVDLPVRPVPRAEYQRLFPKLAGRIDAALRARWQCAGCKEWREGDEDSERFCERCRVPANRTSPFVAGPGETTDSLPHGGRGQDALTAPGADVLPGVTVPGYEILAELGKGGMGIVWRARHVALKRLVALKMILAGNQAKPEQLARFQTEAEAVARLQHPNIVQVYEVGAWQGNPFFSLELCGGGSLADKLQGAPMLPREAAPLLETLARAMHAAHEKNIIHRDLKPANVLLTEDGVPKIGDFGLAKQLDGDSGQTRSGEIMGTPSYMAPEQAMGKTREIGPATDIYALGAMLYELLSGRPPFRGATVWETIEQVCFRDPVPPTQLQPKIPRDLETICLKCLHKEPDRRYASAQDLADDLRRFQHQEPIKARPAGRVERLAKWARRQPYQAAFGAASALFLAVFVFASLREARDYRRKYEQQLQAATARTGFEHKYLAARELAGDSHWGQARDQLVEIQAALDAQTDRLADDLKARVQQTLAEVGQHIQREDEQRQAQLRLQKLLPAHGQAMFHWAPLAGTLLAENRQLARTHARQALAIYGLDGEPGQAVPTIAALERDRELLGPKEFARVAEACYELLFIWAEVEAGAALPAGAPSEQARRRGKRAAALLERAALVGRSVGLDTQALHIRRARYQALSRGESFDAARHSPTASPQPTGALDWFLTALASYQGGHFEEAATAARQALRLQQEHFWARYLQALCHVRAGRLLEAKGDLTICVNQRPGYPLPQLIRGFAASELGARHARQEVQAVRSRWPDAEIAHLKHNKEIEFASARADFDAALSQQLDSQTRYVALANRGVLFIRQERWAEAIADLKKAVAVIPGAFQAHANLAQALQGGGRGAEALAAMNQAIERLPNASGYAEFRVDLYGRERSCTSCTRTANRHWTTSSRPSPTSQRKASRDGWPRTLWNPASCWPATASIRQPWPASIERCKFALTSCWPSAFGPRRCWSSIVWKRQARRWTITWLIPRSRRRRCCRPVGCCTLRWVRSRPPSRLTVPPCGSSPGTP